MARPTLDRNVKFKALVRRLGLPRPYVRGLLETLWDVANECGNPVLTDREAVEVAAEWPGEPGALFAALEEGRWIDAQDGGGYAIHDYWDHAPEYVKGRLRKEQERRRKRNGLVAGLSRDSHATVTQKSDTPSPSPNNKNPPTPQGGRKRAGRLVEPAEGFEAFWSAYPRKAKKPAAVEAWNRIQPDPLLRERILGALARQRSSADWLREGGRYIPHPSSYLNQRRWDDEVVPPAATSPAATPEDVRARVLHERAEAERLRSRACKSPVPIRDAVNGVLGGEPCQET